MELLQQLGQLGPALGSVAVIGIVCWRLLQLFDNHLKAFNALNENLMSNKLALDKLANNVEKNTFVTEQMSSLIKRAT